jgi:hypothetical protein
VPCYRTVIKVWKNKGVVNGKAAKKIEKIQERALRFIYEDYENTYENLLNKSKLPSLKIRRLRTIAVETFKI